VGVRRLLRRRQFDTVGLGATEHPLLVFDREAIEGDEIMDPAHRQDVASGLPGPPGRDERDVSRAANRWIGGAVDEAGDVAPTTVGEGRLLRGKLSG